MTIPTKLATPPPKDKKMGVVERKQAPLVQESSWHPLTAFLRKGSPEFDLR